MCKKILAVLVLSFILQSVCFAATNMTSRINVAINKYKTGNYTGCLQDMEILAGQDPSNPVIYYYLGMSYVQMGDKQKAINYYEKVLTLKPSKALEKYAEQGKRCIETPEKCAGEDLTELDKFISEPFSDGLSQKVRDDLEAKKLEKLRQQLNANPDEIINEESNFKDFAKQRLNFNFEKKPSNAEIVAAMKVLEKAGFTNLIQNASVEKAGVSEVASAQTKTAKVKTQEEIKQEEMLKLMNDPQIKAQQQQLMQLQMMMGNNNNNSNYMMNNNNMMNMLPFMMAQNGKSGMTKEMVQTMMMNQMMPSLFDDNNNDKNR